MNKPLRIVADAHIWEVESAFSRLPGFDVDLHILENSDITPAAVKHADVLLTRSSTRVDASLLAGSSVRFAGTATIGDDHYDKDWLKHQGIRYANAAGSSTGSVIEYMLAVLLTLHHRKYMSIPDTTIGIIGVGRIGQALANHCLTLGMKILLNDPPRQRQENDLAFVPLTTLLEQADILTLHTPLIRHGSDCTVHLLDQTALQQFHGHVIINAARGACLDNNALYEWLNHDTSHAAVLDCWEHEPDVSIELLNHPQMLLATPHIAGHSLDGKAANTQYIYRALCHWLNIRQDWNMHEHLPQASQCIDIRWGSDALSGIHKAITALYPIRHDHDTMTSWGILDRHERITAFTQYRRCYPVRRSWQHIPVHFSNADTATEALAHAIGITTL